jgi:hypothetical protein
MSCTDSPCETAACNVYASQAKTDGQLQDVKVCHGPAQSSNRVGQLPDIVAVLHLMLHGVGLAGTREDVLHR